MKSKLKSLIAVVAALGLIVGGFNVPASATGETVNLVVTNDTLSGSALSGFDANATLRLSLMAGSGTLTWPNNNGSGATLVSNVSSNTQSFWLQGTQAELNAAIAEVTINKPCAGTYEIYAQVSDSGFVKHPVTGHLYKYVNSGRTLDAALADAAATPLVTDGLNTYAYLATVTDSVENQIVNMFGAGWIGASDRDTEGDWKWLAGPEAGTSFYSGRGDQGGAALSGKFAGWGSGEPNDSGNEDYAEIYGDGRWNDSQDGERNYVIEWGGMPGDDLSSVSVVSDSVDIVIQGSFSGAGNQTDPYLVSNLTALEAVASCAAENVYFKQTANITLPTSWAGDQNFQGHYDGNGKTIAYSPGTEVSHNTFGVWAYSGSDRSSFSNLTVTGDLVSTSYGNVGLLFGEGDAALTDITVSGSITTSDGRGDTGGVAGSYGGNLTRVTSSVDLFSTADGNSFGGVVGYFWGTMRNVSWNGQISVSGNGETQRVGGLVGETDCADIYDSRTSGTITVTNNSERIGGLAGYFCGQIRDTQADVDIVATTSNHVGGAVGEADGSLYRTAAYGDVSGADRVGGLSGAAWYNEAYDVYARGNVTATGVGGSLVGYLEEFDIYSAYATGAVTAAISRGLYGEYAGGHLERTHWVPSQSTVAEPSPLQQGEVPYTALESKDYNYYANEGWDISTGWDDDVFTICAGAEDGYPFISTFYTEDPCLDPQSLTPTPTISGTGVEGSALTGTPGTWDAGVALVFAWLADGVVIANETNATYTPVVGDVGKIVTFRVTSTKSGYRTVVKTSLGKTITAIPVVSNLEITVGGFAGNSWWVPVGFWKSIKAGVKAHKNATTITCIGIVAAHPSKAWQKKLGLNRAALACATAKFLNPKLKTKLSWKISKASDKVQRGAIIRFNR